MPMHTQSQHHEALLSALSSAFTSVPFNHLLGLQLDHLDDARVIMSFHMKKELIGNFLYGMLHGGVIASVLDMAGGMVIMSSILHANLEKTQDEIAHLLGKVSTIDLHISFLRPGKGDWFKVTADLVKKGNTVSFAHMQLYNDQEQLIAKAQGTYSLSSK